MRRNYSTFFDLAQQRMDYMGLRAVPGDAAWQHFEDKIKGSIEVGKPADVVLLAENPLTAEPDCFKDLPIVKAIVCGQSRSVVD